MLPDQLLEAVFMDRVEVAEQGADRDCLYLLFFQIADHPDGGLLVERGFDRAVAEDALGYLAFQTCGDDALCLGAEQVVKIGTLLPADLHQVLEALGGDDPDARALLFDQSIGCHCGTMRQVGNLLRLHSEQSKQRLDAGYDRLGRVLWGGTELVVENLLGLGVEHGQVGKGTANIM